MSSWHGRVPAPRDLGAALALAAGTVGGTYLVARLPGAPPLGPVGVLAVVVAAAASAWHRTAPVAATLTTAVAVAGYLLVGQPYGPIQLLMALACFVLARTRPIRRATPVTAATTVLLAFALGTRLTGAHVLAVAAVLIAWTSVFVIVPALLGALLRTKAEAAERAREELLARGAYEERLRMMREVHDIAGHGFAVVALQAGVALTVFDEQPAQARISLTAVRDTAERALAELGQSLDPGYAEQPAASDIPALVDRVRAGGTSVELVVTGRPDGAGRAASTAAYRVVQEALTNMVRHADARSADVAVDYGRDLVTVRVRDTGVGAPPTDGSDGRGLRGLRARVEALGGSFTAGNRPGGGFEVTARLPQTGSRP